MLFTKLKPTFVLCLSMSQRNPPQAVWHHLVLPWCTMISEFKRRGVQERKKYRLCQTSHSSLLVARQGDVFRKLYQAFLLVDSFNFNFVDEERSDIYVTVTCFCYNL